MSIRIVLIKNTLTNKILCLFTEENSNKEIKSICLGVLKKISAEREEKGSLIYDGKYGFYWNKENNKLFMAMTDSKFNYIAAFEFLSKIKLEFNYKFKDDYINKCYTLSLNSHFNQVIKKNYDYYNLNQDNHDDSKLDSLTDSLIETKNSLVDNVDQLIKREENLEHAVKKAKTLEQDAVEYKNNTIKMKKTLTKDYSKLKRVVFFLVLIFLIYSISFIICGGIFLPNCIYKKK